MASDNKTFAVEIEGVFNLSIEEIWPDGDAPANPTASDVAKRMAKYGSAWGLCREWNLPLVVTVDGLDIWGESY